MFTITTVSHTFFFFSRNVYGINLTDTEGNAMQHDCLIYGRRFYFGHKKGELDCDAPYKVPVVNVCVVGQQGFFC